MVERFFCVPQMELEDDGPEILLLSGPPSCGKSSLLFQFAFNSAANHKGSGVVFLCSRGKLEANPPLLSHGADPSCQPFQRIHIKYVDDGEGINKYFAGFHLHPTFPLLVVVHDFAQFFHPSSSNPRGRELAIAGALALCQSALAHAKDAGCRCTLLLSDTHQGGDSSFLYIFKRWASSIYTVQGDGSGSFFLNKTYQSGNATANATAKYSIALQYLVLEAITQDD